MGSLDCELSENIYFYVSNVHNQEYALLKQNRCIFHSRGRLLKYDLGRDVPLRLEK